MKGFLRYSLALFLYILLCGCPYESAIPIDEPTIKIDASLLGKWRSVSDTKKADIITISKFDDNRYKIETGRKKDSSYNVQLAWLSDINGYLYLNLQEAREGKIKYIFMLLTDVNKNRLVYKNIKEADRSPIANSTELRRWISDNMLNTSFYEAGDTLVRVK